MKVDDLTRIKGVTSVLEAKLYEIGVYRFKQIATWNTSQINAFSDRLSFKGRIEREEWISQARALHQEEYGEHVGT